MTGQNENKQARHEQLTRRINLRLSEPDYAQISGELAACGLSLSEFGRKRLLGQRVASKADLAVLAELRRLGGLLKHTHNETRGAYSALTAQAIKDLSSYVRALTAKRNDVSGDAGDKP